MLRGGKNGGLRLTLGMVSGVSKGIKIGFRDGEHGENGAEPNVEIENDFARG